MHEVLREHRLADAVGAEEDDVDGLADEAELEELLDEGAVDLRVLPVNQRYLRRSTIVTTNRIFGDWAEVFPNAVSIVALADRLCHKAEILTIDADSYRTKETHERNTARRSRRKS